MSIIERSFRGLFPSREWKYTERLEYNRRLAPFNANILHSQDSIRVHMNLEWKNIDEEIRIGLIQHLLLKVFRSSRVSTTNIDLYTNFTKNIHMLCEKKESDPVLEASFERNNTRFFGEALEKPNLKWGKRAIRRLASYNYHNDTITMSTIFEGVEDERLLDYVMYHEMLHKHFKFEHNNGRHSYHSKEFRAAERLFENWQELERNLGMLVRGTRVVRKKRGLLSFFGR